MDVAPRVRRLPRGVRAAPARAQHRPQAPGGVRSVARLAEHRQVIESGLRHIPVLYNNAVGFRQSRPRGSLRRPICRDSSNRNQQYRCDKRFTY